MTKERGKKEDQFLKDLSAESGLPVDVCRKVYHGIVRLTTKELRSRKVINLPHIGRLMVSKLITRKSHDIQTGKYIDLMYYKLSFTVNKNLKEYMAKILL